MRRSARVSMLLVFLAGALPLAYAGYVTVAAGDEGRLASPYWQGTMGSWLATMIGVAAGLPIALWINRQVQREADERKAAEERSRADARRQRILRIVEQELRQNFPDLEQMAQGTVVRFRLYRARWNAIAAGGELRWIAETDLLDEIAHAYEALGAVSTLAEQWLVAVTSPPREWDDRGQEVTEVLRSLVTDAAADALAATKAALNALSRAT